MVLMANIPQHPMAQCPLDLNDFRPQATYVDKDDITETIATDWAKAALGEEQIVVMKAGLKANVDEQMNPTKETFSVGE